MMKEQTGAFQKTASLILTQYFSLAAPSNNTPDLREAVHSYEDAATEHYNSDSRRDGVKVCWEEPFFCQVLNRAIRHISREKGKWKTPFRVGAGAVTGLLLQIRRCPTHYVGGYLKSGLKKPMYWVRG